MFEILKMSTSGYPGKLSIFDLYYRQDQIDFDPEYQRYGNIWDLRQKQLLIDSIINEYDLPKFYFHLLTDRELNNSGKRYAVIDGRQRLQTIFEFMDDRYALSNDFMYLLDERIDLSKKYYSDLAIEFPLIKAHLDSYILDIVYIITDEIERIEELFLRLNEGEPLNNAEKRKAIGGETIRWVNEVVRTNEFFTYKVRFQNKRSEHQDVLTKILFLEYNKGFKSFSKRALDNLIENNKQASGILDCFAVVENNLMLLSSIFIDYDPILRTKSMLPLYYYFVKENAEYRECIRDFLIFFEQLRKDNRRLDSEDQIPILLHYDRLSQQGANQQTSMILRFNILNRYFKIFINEGRISLYTKIITNDLLSTVEDLD
ncbi:DUF262 domain-containing protein [Paenibacillus odorifer]|uniref:DUF262 domain-containing protein n=1 Tax=Paenibacillus odorifer TaxID=189426 RepID=UPI00289DB725|nr:DUF262 domain-containing protein [Paenibacillus odorifer]